MDKYMDKYRKIIKSLIKKQEKKLEKLNRDLSKKEFDRERMCLKANYLDGETFKRISAIEDILTPKTDLETEDE